MTGGQPAEGGLTVSQIAHQVSAEGAKRLVIVSDDPEKYPAITSPQARPFIIAANSTRAAGLREVKGLTVLVYDQTCAAEKRRRRKRGLYPDPPKRVFINERVCEGCGDCSAVSNCVSVQPLETESAASGGSTSRTATRIFPASKAFARVLSPCMAAAS